MSLWTWSEAISVKVDALDNQHKKLIIALNALEESIDNKNSKGIMKKLLKALNAYTEKHFTFEEQHLTEAGYPKIEEHKAKHQEIIDQLSFFQDKMEKEDLYMMDMQMLEFLKNWLMSHIMIEDKKYRDFLFPPNED